MTYDVIIMPYYFIIMRECSQMYDLMSHYYEIVVLIMVECHNYEKVMSLL